MRDEESDYYATLGLDRKCSAADIRKAYRLLSKRHHPDLNPGCEESVRRSQELNRAYETLGDPVLRQRYDRERAEVEQDEPTPRRAPRLEKNIKQDLLLRMIDFLRGVHLEVRVNDPGNPAGQEVYPLEIPPDTAPGTRFRLPRSGLFAGGQVVVRVKAQPGGRLKPKGFDVQCELRISSRRAAEGGMEMVQGITGGPIRVEIPRGVARGEIISIPREGLPNPRGGRGNLLVKITYRPEVRIVRSRG